MNLSNKYQSLQDLQRLVHVDDYHIERCHCGNVLKRTGELVRGVCNACQLGGPRFCGYEQHDVRSEPMPKRKKSSQKRRKRQREILLKRQHGRCHFCKVIMCAEGYELKYKPMNLAVLFHLDSRYSDERGQHQGEFRHVLACRLCADQRSKTEQASVPLRELRIRAGHSGRVGA